MKRVSLLKTNRLLWNLHLQPPFSLSRPAPPSTGAADSINKPLVFALISVYLPDGIASDSSDCFLLLRGGGFFSPGAGFITCLADRIRNEKSARNPVTSNILQFHTDNVRIVSVKRKVCLTLWARTRHCRLSAD